MNFLAHAHLSGDNQDVLFGNFIADSVKGKDFQRFNSNIQLGIKLHRQIDSFTDSHPVFKKTLGRIRENFGKYSGVAVDIYYDHFLAKNWPRYHHLELGVFANSVYRILNANYEILPARTKRLLPFLVTQNWLVGYASLNDLQLVFYGMDRRTGLKSGMSSAVVVLQQNYPDIQTDFEVYYPQLVDFANEMLAKLRKEYD